MLTCLSSVFRKRMVLKQSRPAVSVTCTAPVTVAATMAVSRVSPRDPACNVRSESRFGCDGNLRALVSTMQHREGNRAGGRDVQNRRARLTDCVTGRAPTDHLTALEWQSVDCQRD